MAIISTFSMKYIEYCSSKGGSTTSSYDYLLSVTRTYFLLFGDKESDRHTGQQKVHCFPPFNSWNKIKHTHTKTKQNNNNNKKQKPMDLAGPGLLLIKVSTALCFRVAMLIYAS